jgi:hypothetical protein
MACELYIYIYIYIGALTGRLLTTGLDNSWYEDSISSFQIISNPLFAWTFNRPTLWNLPRTDMVVKYQKHNTKSKVHVPPTCIERCIRRSARSISVTPPIIRPLSEPVRLSILLLLLQENSVFTQRSCIEHLSAECIKEIYFQGTIDRLQALTEISQERNYISELKYIPYHL